MSYTVETLENGLRIARGFRIARRGNSANPAEQPAGQTAQSSFSAELGRAAQAAAKTETAEGVDMESALDGLSAQSKDLLNRMKRNVTRDEWDSLLQDLLGAGLISQREYLHSNPNIVLIGYTDANGDIVLYPPYDGNAAVTKTFSDGSAYMEDWGGDQWPGDPFELFDEWLENMRKWQAGLEEMVRPNGVKYDTSHITRMMEDRQRVHALVQRLIAMA